jgi:GDP-D-mannose dehydratase
LGIELEWKGEGIDKATGKVLVEVDPKYFRPAEVELLRIMKGRPETGVGRMEEEK